MRLTADFAVKEALAILCGSAAAFAQSAPAQPSEAVAQPAATAPAERAADGAPMMSDESEKWKFRLTPYFMLGAMDGHVTVKGRQSDVNQDLGDVVNEIKDYLNFGAAVHFEAEKGKWGIFTDLSYMDLQATHELAGGNRAIEASLKQFIGELGIFYTVVPPRAISEGSSTFRLDLLGGARVTWLQLGVDPDASGETTKDKEWIDPFFGARAMVGFNDWLTGALRGDIGGFDLAPGTTSKLAWQIDASLTFRLSRVIDLLVGYRWLSQDYEDGSGTNLFVYDIVLNGPYLGLTFKF